MVMNQYRIGSRRCIRARISGQVQTVFTGYNQAVMHMNSQWLWLHEQDLYKSKPDTIPALKDVFTTFPFLGERTWPS